MPIDVSQLRHRRVTDRRNRASVGDVLERQTWSRPDAPALVAGADATEVPSNARMTYAQADQYANRLANAYLAAGLKSGDILLLVCENSVDALLSKIAAAKAGLTVAPLNPILAPDVVESIVTQIRPAAAIIDVKQIDRLAAMLGERGVPLLAAPAIEADPDPGVPSMTQFADGRPATEPDVAINGDDIWQLLFTSGSTATPKAAMQSHHNTYYNAMAWSPTLTLGLRRESEATFASYLPTIYHVADALLYSTWMVGGTVVLGRRPDHGRLARSVSDHKVTHVWAGLPQFVDALVREFESDPSLDASSLQSITFGWAPLEGEVYDRLLAVAGKGVRIQSIIGMTEVVVAHRFWVGENEGLFRETTPRDNYVGQPSPVLAARLVDEADETLPLNPGMTGEVVYRSPALVSGYYLEKDATDSAMRGEWFHTGDLLAQGQDGNRIMVDRLKDVIKSGGENVSSIRVEAILEQHPSVQRAAVVGLPHARWGEAVTATVQIREGASDPGEATLIDHAKKHLAPYEVPKAIITVEDLPTSVGGKLQKFKVRELAARKNPYGEAR